MGRASGVRLPRPVIRPLAERVLQILVRRPDWALGLDRELEEFFDEAQAGLLAWIHDKLNPQGGTTFAVLHEAALAEGRERGSEVVRFFLKLAKPDQALDELLDDQPDQLREEFDRAVVRLKIRALEDEAARLAAAADTHPPALAQLQSVRARIQELKG